MNRTILSDDEVVIVGEMRSRQFLIKLTEAEYIRGKELARALHTHLAVILRSGLEVAERQVAREAQKE
jgi:hypothetical protein